METGGPAARDEANDTRKVLPFKKLEDIPPTRPAVTEKSPNRQDRIRSNAQMALTASKRQAFLDYVRVGETIVKAAERVGVDPSTIQHWREDPGFAEAYAEARKHAIDAANDELDGITPRAVKAIGNAVDSEDIKLSAEYAHKHLRGRGLYRESREVQGEVTHKLETAFDTLSAEELREWLAEVRDRRAALPEAVEGSYQEVEE